ncbi:MAG TPA: type VI secretion system protein TssA, partial [Gemmatales bacterium]|nr:type VI secretion system protein TssA [Gemmatales bacterium]
MSILDIDALLAPIEGHDDPAGVRTPDAVRETWKEARLEINPDDFAEDDPARPGEAKRADWRTIIRLCEDCLKNKSKDLVVAAWLTEAMTKEYGMAGLAEALVLLRRLIEEAWDRLYPQLEYEDDLEFRAGAFNWLDERDSGARFPMSLEQLPVIGGPDGFGYLDWKGSGDPKADASLRDRVSRAKERMSGAECQELAENIQQVIEALMELNRVFGERFSTLGSGAPSLSQVRQAVLNIKQLADGMLKEKGGAPGALGGPGDEGGGGGGGGSGGGGGLGSIDLSNSAAAREQIYNELERLASLLKSIEPHSPVPYLVERAVSAGRKPFPEMIRAFIGRLPR